MAANEAGKESKTNGELGHRREPPVVIVDLANVAYGRQGRGESAKLANVNAVLEELGRTAIKVVTVADAALRHKIDRQEEYEKMIDSGQVEQAPAGTDADDFIWSLANRYRSKGRATYVLTNDRFPVEKAKKEGMAHPDRITFMFVEGELLFQPPLSELVGPGGEPPPQSAAVERSAPPGLPPLSESTESHRARAITSTEPTRKLASLVAPERPEPPAVPPELLERLRGFFSSRATLGSGSLRVNFATVAHFLHSLYGGNFTMQFGFRRPKDLALALEANGYATLSHHTTTLYIEPTAKLIEGTPARELS